MLQEQLAVITGASSGFGLLTSIELAKKGITVIATMRDITKASLLLETAEKANVPHRIHVYPLDVTCDQSVAEFQDYMLNQERIDVLINNAGRATGGFVEEIELEQYKSQFETNFFGVLRVTKAILPKMRAQEFGKIFNISSISGQIGFPGLSPYVSSKFALEGLSESLRLELKPYGIDVALIEPGSYKTRIWNAGKKIISQSRSTDSPYYTYLKSIENYLNAKEQHFGDPLEVAQLIAELSTQPKLNNLRYPIGKGVKTTFSIKNNLPWRFWEKIIIKKLIK